MLFRSEAGEGAHSGPAFATLAGLALFAASDEGDLRSGFGGTAEAEDKGPGGWLGRMIAAFRTQY